MVKVYESFFELFIVTLSCGHKRYLLLVSIIIVYLFIKCVHFYKNSAKIENITEGYKELRNSNRKIAEFLSGNINVDKLNLMEKGLPVTGYPMLDMVFDKYKTYSDNKGYVLELRLQLTKPEDIFIDEKGISEICDAMLEVITNKIKKGQYVICNFVTRGNQLVVNIQTSNMLHMSGINNELKKHDKKMKRIVTKVLEYKGNIGCEYDEKEQNITVLLTNNIN